MGDDMAEGSAEASEDDLRAARRQDWWHMPLYGALVVVIPTVLWALELAGVFD